MEYRLRELDKSESDILEDFIYEAIFLPDGCVMPPRSIVQAPELQVYIENWGKPDDVCIVSECKGRIVGAAWTRIMNDYGHIDNETPSFAISLYKEYRGHGIGTAMMSAMLNLLRSKGYSKASLAVQKANYAVRMYKSVGFEVVDENEDEYIMLCRL